ncbi:antitoxin Xre/MbcA/ParS toxin-binding domain-containing protein [Vibrio splendidus]|nr:antitoxin Xre/MbcA/ParS toxin-binding domain-containing protein [Vibrio splendidus]MCC4880316.1 MbcA/ParS/Xre antitoxin family protein [Vibrio splendidus]
MQAQVLKVDVDRLCKSPSASLAYLKQLRESHHSVNELVFDGYTDVDALAFNYMLIPTVRVSSLNTALLLNQGINGKIIKALSNIIPKDMLARILSVSQTNLSNQYRKKELDKSQSEATVEFLNIWSELMTLFGDDVDLVKEWLVGKKRPLCDKAPVELMDIASGRKAVLEMIDRIKTGDFS